MRKKYLKYLCFAAVSTILLANTPNVLAEDGTVFYPKESKGIQHIYDYSDSTQVEILVKPLYITDIALYEGEEITSITAGDTSRFMVDTDIVNDVPHVYVKATQYGIQTNMVINTNARSYRFLVTSSDEAEYYVSFNYPDTVPDSVKAVKAATDRELKEIKAIRQAEEKARLANANYKVKQNHKVYDFEVPQFMFDDGTKTYIKIRKENKNNLPTIYYYDSRIPKDKLQLVNYRIKGEFFEIDRVAQSWKIVYQQDAYLVVERNNKAKIAKKSSINLQQGNTHEALEYIANKNLNYPNKVVLLDQKESLTSVEKQRLNEINTIVDKKVDESVSIKLQDKEVVIDSSGTGSGQSNVSADQELQNALADIQNQRSQATLTM